VFFVILLGIALVAIGITATLGGAWATVAAVLLVAIGLKVLFMGTAFGFFRRRARAGWQRGQGPDESGRYGPWPCGRRSEAFKARMDEWHETAHADVGDDHAATAGGRPTAE
jgi:hypothetical protein